MTLASAMPSPSSKAITKAIAADDRDTSNGVCRAA